MFGNHKRFLYICVALLCIFFLGVFTTHAALKDSDVDGLTDEAEVKVYLTDPNKYDTDGDTFDDGYEIVNNTNPLDAKDNLLKEEGQKDTVIPRMLTVRNIAWATGVAVLVIGCYFLIRLYISTSQTNKLTMHGEFRE